MFLKQMNCHNLSEKMRLQELEIAEFLAAGNTIIRKEFSDATLEKYPILNSVSKSSPNKIRCTPYSGRIKPKAFYWESVLKHSLRQKRIII